MIDDVIGPETAGDDFPLMNECAAAGIGLRDDSILVQPPPRSWFHAALAQKFWPTVPTFVEHEHYGSSIHRGAWNDELLAKSVEEYHATYLSIHWWPDAEWNNCKETIRKINLRLGYRIVPRRVEFPQSAKIGEFFEVKSVWSNAGVAPCYDGGFFALTLKDDRGGIVAVLTDESFDVKNLAVGPADAIPTTERVSRFRAGYIAPTTGPGNYDVFISIGRRDGTPIFELPIEGDDGQRRYKIGKMELVP